MRPDARKRAQEAMSATQPATAAPNSTAAGVGLTEDEREALWQASLDYWRRLPWWTEAEGGDPDWENGEREIFLGGEGRNIAAAVERILAARRAAALAEIERRIDEWFTALMDEGHYRMAEGAAGASGLVAEYAAEIGADQ